MPRKELPEYIYGYKVVRELGKGDFAVVYLVEDKQIP